MIPVPQSHVTPEMTAWSKEILGSGMPIGASIGRVFDGLYVTAKVEIHRWIGATNEQRPGCVDASSRAHGVLFPACPGLVTGNIARGQRF